MTDVAHFTSVSFRNYKALRHFSISLQNFNILVGPNNSGKSTILGAFRILAEGMRKATSRNPEPIRIRREDSLGYRVPLDELPIALENVFSNYDDTQPAIIDFRLSNGNRIELQFPETNICYMVCKTQGRPVRSPSDFKREYKTSVGFVPVLGPVEHDEPLYQKEAARRALLTHRASRNFRNIWYHYKEDFSQFRDLIRSTWPGMDIEPPELDLRERKPTLRMFCPEERYPREIYWAGFGFQVWCQMLTFIVRSNHDSLLIIDEPDIYLHSDLQRQLVSLLRGRESDVLIATHSTEIISEADPGELLVINKKARSAKRITDPVQLQAVFGSLGSNLNPTLTQLAKSRRALFVEGQDFQILAAFARKLGLQAVSNRSDFAVIASQGFNPQKVLDLASGMELTLGNKILRAVIFDRDYRSEEELAEVDIQLSKTSSLVHIHKRKEIENYLLEPLAIDRAISRQIAEHNKRTDKKVANTKQVDTLLDQLTSKMKQMVSAQFLAKRSPFEKAKKPGADYATINQKLLEEFEDTWNDWSGRKCLVPGKELLSQLNKQLQEECSITITPISIISAMLPNEVPDEIACLLNELDRFRRKPVSSEVEQMDR
jgi:AAA15 family ATPase/GTPase